MNRYIAFALFSVVFVIRGSAWPGCWINIIPAGGLVLIPEASSGCTCGYPLQTSMAFIPK